MSAPPAGAAVPPVPGFAEQGRHGGCAGSLVLPCRTEAKAAGGWACGLPDAVTHQPGALGWLLRLRGLGGRPCSPPGACASLWLPGLWAALAPGLTPLVLLCVQTRALRKARVAAQPGHSCVLRPGLQGRQLCLLQGRGFLHAWRCGVSHTCSHSDAYWCPGIQFSSAVTSRVGRTPQ